MSADRSTLIFEQGALYPAFMRALVLIVGLLLLVAVIGLPILAMSMLNTGTEIDIDRKRMREYSSILALRWGNWMPLSGFAAVTVLRQRRTSTMFSRGQQSQDFQEVNHDAVLLSAKHRRKQVLKACDTREEAMAIARLVSERTGFPFEQYAPRPIGPRRR